MRKKEPEIAQRWVCDECSYEYAAPIAILSITCSNRHRAKQMRLAWGDKIESKPKPKAKPKPKEHPPLVVQPELPSRPKAQQVTNTKLLLEALGIKE
jgi:hypothetical protein